MAIAALSKGDVIGIPAALRAIIMFYLIFKNPSVWQTISHSGYVLNNFLADSSYLQLAKKPKVTVPAENWAHSPHKTVHFLSYTSVFVPIK